MPRLLSSYAANKRVEDGLKKKQEQIRLDYMRTTHRHLDETDKLVDELIQIHVRTPNAFQNTPRASANNPRRPLQRPQAPYHHNNNHGLHNHHQQQQQHATNQQQQQQQQQQPSIPSLPNPYQNAGNYVTPNHAHDQALMMKARFRSRLTTSDGATDDGTSQSRKEIPLPVVQVCGNEVFYQYENHRSAWKKVEPAYKTKVLLHRNNTVSKALRQYADQRKAEAEMAANQNTDVAQLRRESDGSRRKSVFSRRSSEMSRRGSRRASKFSNLVDDEVRIPPILDLKPQLSPGHTPRMLDGWTIMNWCLWKKQQSKPVWASRQYMERKEREFRLFQASRSKGGKPKPSSAHTSRSDPKEQLPVENDLKILRAKSVPLHKNQCRIDEENEDSDDEDELDVFPESPDAEKAVVRPITSILRSSTANVDPSVDELRPKTTQPRRRIALNDFIAPSEKRTSFLGEDVFFNTDADNDGDHDDDSSDNQTTYRELGKDILRLRSKPTGKVELVEPETVPGHRENEINGEKKLENSGGANSGDGSSGCSGRKKPAVQIQSQPVTKVTEATPVFPQFKVVVPELGTDSPR